MIKETANEYRFTQVLLNDEYASWSYGATKALFDYYEQLSDDIGEDIELDPVAIRRDWTESASALGFALNYSEFTPSDAETLEEGEEHARQWLEERATVLDVENVDLNSTEYRTIKSVLVMPF